ARSTETSKPAEQQAPIEQVQEKVPEEDLYAVTRQEVEALLRDDDKEVVGQPDAHEHADAEDEPVVSSQFDAIFDDDVMPAVVDEAEAEPLQVPVLFEDKLAPEFADAIVEDAAGKGEHVVQAAEPIETIPAAEADSVLNENNLSAVAQAPDEEPKIEDTAPAETEVAPVEEESDAKVPLDEAIQAVAPEADSHERGLDEIVAEAERWMAQIAPETEQDAADKETPLAEPEPEPLGAPAELVDVITPFDASGIQPDRQFDEVVSELQGEEAIIPVEDEHAEAELPHEQAAAEKTPTTPEAEASAEEPEDVKLRIIQDMKDRGLRSSEDRSGVPRFDLSESALAGIVEFRKGAAATRKGPGKKGKPETIETQVDAAEAGAEPARPETGAMERMHRGKQRQIIAGIVARDIEKFCTGRTEHREERARLP
ncbi:MAG TPA: hypothetical protein VLH60_04510, partial [Sedimentisphaerales bacterium]|nr:hypothetical protein [Sedimentisphaerales bacterium]